MSTADKGHSVKPLRALNIVSTSSGIGSAFTWKLAIDECGRDAVVPLFADVNGEHPDNYRFLREVAGCLGQQVVRLDNGGRNIWDVMCERKFLANSRADVRSQELKRKPIRAWLADNAPAGTVWLGFDWTEKHRYLGTDTTPGWKQGYEAHGYVPRAPMVERTLDKGHALSWLSDVGIEPPLLTRLGFPHANCGGGCVKSGAKWFKMLLRLLPDWFAWWEAGEERVRQYLGRTDIAILRDRRGGRVRPMTLRELRESVSVQGDLFDDDDGAVCGCFALFGDEAA